MIDNLPVFELFGYHKCLVPPVYLGLLVDGLVAIVEDSNYKIEEENIREQHESCLQNQGENRFSSVRAIVVRPQCIHSASAVFEVSCAYVFEVGIPQHFEKRSK